MLEKIKQLLAHLLGKPVFGVDYGFGGDKSCTVVGKWFNGKLYIENVTFADEIMKSNSFGGYELFYNIISNSKLTTPRRDFIKNYWKNK